MIEFMRRMRKMGKCEKCGHYRELFSNGLCEVCFAEYEGMI